MNERSQFTIWLDRTNKEVKRQYIRQFKSAGWKPLTYVKGRKFIKIKQGSSVWGFVSMVEGVHKGALVCKGDLLKAESWQSPAKHSRGNIFDGTARFGVFGPKYL